MKVSLKSVIDGPITAPRGVMAYHESITAPRGVMEEHKLITG